MRTEKQHFDMSLDSFKACLVWDDELISESAMPCGSSDPEKQEKNSQQGEKTRLLISEKQLTYLQ
jgi:hypothetical protein